MSAEDLARLLDQLGQRLGPTGERVFALAVRQVWIDGLLGVGAAVVAAAFMFIALPRLYRWGRSGDGYSTRDLEAVVAGLIVVLIGGLIVANGVYALSRLLNPEYAAIRDLLGAIGR